MYIAIDIGGTSIRIASFDALDQPTIRAEKKIPMENHYDSDIAHIQQAIQEIREGKAVDGIGICSAGKLSTDKMHIVNSPNYPTWINRDIVTDMATFFNTRVLLENDAAAAALGEALYGSGQNKEFVFLIWGTGFGGTQVIWKEQKAILLPFEPGHQIITWDNGLLCGCGQYGCIETFIGGGNIRKYRGKDPLELSHDEWEEVVTYLAQALVNITNMRSTNTIIFGGGIAFKQSEKVEHAVRIAQERLKMHAMPEVSISQLGEKGSLFGALALLHQ